MSKLSVCILTFNSGRTLERCLRPVLSIADEIVVVDSGSTDESNAISKSHGISPHFQVYETHAKQMNFAISLAAHDWVLCLDSDEFLDEVSIANIRSLKPDLIDDGVAYRITRYWHVLGEKVRAIYPVSSPDYPVRLFNRKKVRFNDQPVDDKPMGFSSVALIHGAVVHDTFFSLDEVFSKANSYTTRLVKNKSIDASIASVFLSPLFAFAKWYFRKGAWRDGAIGLVTAGYAAVYSFLKYLKAWAKKRDIPLK